VTTSPSLDTTLHPLTGNARPLREWLTTFHLASVVIDPFTNESAWILETAARVLHQFADAAVRVNFIVAGSPSQAKQFLGPLADQFLTFSDPDRIMIKQLGLSQLPAFVFIQSDGTVPASAEGWSPASWRTVANHIAQTVQWQQPLFPVAGDPGSFKGTPALA
jgi:hypothetical protein